MRTNPATIRSVVLNSPFPPNSTSWAEQTTVAAEGFAAIARACSAQAACRDRFGDVGAKLDETLLRLEKAPQRSGDTIVNERQIAKALWPLAVRTNTVKYVPLAIDRVHAGDLTLMTRMVKLFAGGGSFGAYSPAQTLAIMCPESGRTSDWYIRARNLYPAFASDEPADGFDLRCAAFRPGYVDATFFAPVASDIPTLVYAGSFDPATPLIDAYQTIRFLPNATLVEVSGASHNPIATDECTLAIAAAFLDDPTVRPDIACLAARPEIEFATEGLDGLLASMEE